MIHLVVEPTKKKIIGIDLFKQPTFYEYKSYLKYNINSLHIHISLTSSRDIKK